MTVETSALPLVLLIILRESVRSLLSGNVLKVEEVELRILMSSEVFGTPRIAILGNVGTPAEISILFVSSLFMRLFFRVVQSLSESRCIITLFLLVLLHPLMLNPRLLGFETSLIFSSNDFCSLVSGRRSLIMM